MTITQDRADAIRSLNAERLELLDEIERMRAIQQDQREAATERHRARNLEALATMHLREVGRELARLQEQAA